MRRRFPLAAISILALAIIATTQPAPATASTAAPKAAKKTPSKPKTSTKSAGKAAPKSAVKPIAPDTLAHPIALFLSSMCSEGTKRVSFKAQAVGTRFFLEDSTGVAIYAFDGVAYRKESFAKGATIAKVLKRYGRRASGTS